MISCLTSALTLGSSSRVDRDGTNDFVFHHFDFNAGTSSLRWARITNEGMLDSTDLVFTPDLFDLPSLGANEVYGNPSPRALEDMNGDGLPDLIFIATVLAPNGAGIRYRFYYTLNTLPPPSPQLVGDVDGDGIVGILDFLLVLANWTV